MTTLEGNPGQFASSVGALPTDRRPGTLIGRVWNPRSGGPSPVTVRNQDVFDISSDFATVRDLCEERDPAAAARSVRGQRIGNVLEILRNTPPSSRDSTRPWLLAPVDLQTLKAAGVTFVVSMLERLIEERVRGDAAAADEIRKRMNDEVGADILKIRPGSFEAAEFKNYLLDRGLWSQYLEVGIGPDAEIFTKAPTLAAVGTGETIGIPKTSTWNNPEPEVGLVVRSDSVVIGATLANDVNLRDLEGRSALLLPQAKDNNASCAVGPFIRLFDATFDLDTVRSIVVKLEIDGQDGFHLDAVSDMSAISRDPLELVEQLWANHQYPDGALLMLGTMFAPVTDRDAPGQGFTHKEGDVVAISATELGALVNEVVHGHKCSPWTFGIAALMRNLAERKLL